jgi:hypothetical protein
MQAGPPTACRARCLLAYPAHAAHEHLPERRHLLPLLRPQPQRRLQAGTQPLLLHELPRQGVGVGVGVGGGGVGHLRLHHMAAGGLRGPAGFPRSLARQHITQWGRAGLIQRSTAQWRELLVQRCKSGGLSIKKRLV